MSVSSIHQIGKTTHLLSMHGYSHLQAPSLQQERWLYQHTVHLTCHESLLTTADICS